ncbi:flagellar biosynthesis protein FliO [Metarhizobium album]|uniref:Flagellar biosynthesis protein FliO n=1 Tax=Metarhizobium album TaxID=2182425 RepID=A0A2U2DTF1_9HYPH|nr:flagellar biosynthetic protein FliO [Rhizobium album]PWE56581.1 flagellar biosynthesis protein FliO [Rhizobium album]
MEDLIATYGGRLLVAVAGVGIALVCLVFVLRFIRNRAPAPFLRGGRNRQPRLQVLDAAAIDARRRLVLIRRDDVEHLVMIGGPTDIVIETRIRAGGSIAAAVEDEDDRRHEDYYSATDDDFIADEEENQEDYRRDDDRPVPPVARTAAASNPPARLSGTSNPAAEWRNRAEAVTEPVVVTPPAMETRQRSLDLDRPVPATRAEEPAVAVSRPAALNPLEAARRKLFPAEREKAAVQPVATPVQKSVPTERATATPERQQTPVAGRASAANIGSEIDDFERMLEAEMAARLEANRGPGQSRDTAQTPRPVTVVQQASRPQQQQPAANDREQRAMQQEMARIFGESAPRYDK